MDGVGLGKEECLHLRHEMKVGLRKMLPIEELQRKAISLHEDIIDDCISRELRKLQAKMDQATEKGWRQEFLDLSRRRKELESQPVRKQLANDFLKMIADVQTFSEEILDDQQGKQGPVESIPNKDTSSTLKILHDKNQNEVSASAIATNMEFKGNLATKAGHQPFKSLSYASAQAERWIPGRLTREVEENCRPTFIEILQGMVIEEQRVKSMAVEPSANISAERNSLICMAPQQGVVTPVHQSPTIRQQSNHRPCSSGGLEITGPVQFDDNTTKLVRDIELPDGLVWGEQYTDEELLNFGYEYEAKMILLKREIMRRSAKVLKDQGRFDAECRNLEMNIIEANKKFNTTEDELEKLKVKMEEDALSNASKISMMEKDAKLSAAKIRKLEAAAQLSAVKIRNMEEAARLSGIKLSKMEEDARASSTKISEMEKDAWLSTTTIISLKTKIMEMYKNRCKQIEEVKAQSAQEALSCYKRSKLFVDDVFKLLSPIYSAGWTDSLKEIKAKHLPDLDLSEFPRFDLNAWEKADFMYYTISNSPIQLEELSQGSNCIGVGPSDPNASASGF